MRIKKVPCLAWIRSSLIPENVGLIVEVTEKAPDINGVPFWYVTSKTPTRCVDTTSFLVLPVKFNDGVCEDEALTPINDPDIDTSETEIVAPIVEKQWEFPKEKENV